MKMICKIFSVESIKNDNNIVNEMFSLMKKHYENMKEDKFLADLYDKDDVFLIFDGEILKGFSTIKKINVELKNENNENSEKISGFFSGDTIIEKGFSWGIEFQKEWINIAFWKVKKI